MTPRRPANPAPRWRCHVCGAHGIGGLDLWRAHYQRDHYREDGYYSLDDHEAAP